MPTANESRSVKHLKKRLALGTLEPVSPILRWAGSKRKLLPKLLPFWGAVNTRYVEPFVGSGALYFAAAPEKSILSDINLDLIHTYRIVRTRPDDVAYALQKLPRDKDTYIRLRKLRPQELSATDQATRFIYLNRHCFNGLYRTNLDGAFNVPYAPTKTGSLPSREHLREVAMRLRGARLLHGDFETVIKRVVRSRDFIYLDPPFAVGNRRLFRQYNGNTFGFDDLHRLAALLYAIDAIGAFFVLSYAVSRESLAAFAPWHRRRVITNRNIAGFAAHRRRAAELIVTNIRV